MSDVSGRHYDFLFGMYRARATQAEVDAYFEGVSDGFRAYAWWKDGTQNVGTCGGTLSEALRDLGEDHASFPPHLCEERTT